MPISYIPLYDEVNPGQIFSPDKTITNFTVAIINNLIEKLNLIITGGETYLNVEKFSDSEGEMTQAGLQLAIDNALAMDVPLWWPSVFMATANLDDFHSVRHAGPGGVIRGSNTFYVEPTVSQTNRLFTSPSGTVDNDGLTALFPTTNVQATTRIQWWGMGGLTGLWEINLAAGTYTQGLSFDSLIWMEYPITVKGPTIAHPGVPTAIIDLTATPSETGLECPTKLWITAQYIKVINALTGRGFANGGGASLILTNCHTDNCLRAIVNSHCGQLTVRGGDFDGNDLAGSYGYASFYNATHSVEGTVDSTDAPNFHNFYCGIFINEGVQGHLDYCICADNEIGLWFARSAGACNTALMQVHRNDVGVQADNQWFNNNIIFGTGADANTVNVRTYGGAPEYDYRCIDYASRTPRQQVQLATQSAHTGTTNKTPIWTLTEIIRNWMVSEAGGFIELDVYIEGSLSNGAVSFAMDINNGGADDLFTTVTLPQNTTDIWLKVVIAFTAANQQRCFMQAMTAPVIGTDNVDTGSAVIDLKNNVGNVILSAQLVNASDSVTILWGRCVTTLGG